jgi:putative chitinase
MTPALTLQQLQKHWPHARPDLLAGMAAAAPTVFPKYGINTVLTLAVMMGQFSEETGGGVEMIENIRYSPARAVQLWPSHFHSVAELYAKIGSTPTDPLFCIKLMDNVYGNRMGNRPGTHDGSTYIGRGLSQCTGREGYIAVGLKTKLDTINHPELLTNPDTALECGVADFVICGCLPYAVNGDVLNTTKRLNGGLIGYSERQSWTAAWRHEFGV